MNFVLVMTVTSNRFNKIESFQTANIVEKPIKEAETVPINKYPGTILLTLWLSPLMPIKNKVKNRKNNNWLHKSKKNRWKRTPITFKD